MIMYIFLYSVGMLNSQDSFTDQHSPLLVTEGLQTPVMFIVMFRH